MGYIERGLAMAERKDVTAMLRASGYLKGVIGCLVIVLLAACTTDPMPNQTDFAVKLSTSQRAYRVAEPVDFTTELANISNRSFEIRHASPLITVQAYDEHQAAQVESILVDDIGLPHRMNARESYYPEQAWPNAPRTLKFDEPGTYTLIGTATFYVEGKNGQRETYAIESEPYEIVVR